MEEQKKSISFRLFLRTLPKHIKVQLWLLLALPVNILLILLADRFPETVEKVYANGVRPPVMQAISRLTGVLPFSLAEVLILSAACCAVPFLSFAVVEIVRTVKRKESVALKFVDWTSRFLAVLFCGVLLFGMTYGLCYYRKNTCLDVCKYHLAYAEKDIANIAAYMTVELNEVRAEAGLDENEPYSFRLTSSELAESCREAYRKLAEEYPRYGGDYGNPKPVALSVPWTYTFVMGMYFPFTGEANYNTNIPSLELPHTVLHEMAHQRGIAAEDEANFAAFLAGRYATDSRVKYSALFESWCLVMNALYQADPERYDFVLSIASDGVCTDRQNIDSFWSLYDGSLATVSDEVNRRYLESNGVKFGTASYSLSVQYILDYYVNTYLMDYVVLNE